MVVRCEVNQNNVSVLDEKAKNLQKKLHFIRVLNIKRANVILTGDEAYTKS